MNRRQVLAAAGAAGSVALTGCLGTSPPSVAGHERTGWPVHGFDRGNTAYNPDGVGPRVDAELDWEYDTGSPTMHSSPVIVDDVVYGAGTGETASLFALDLETGEELWTAGVDGLPGGAPLVTDDIVYLGAWDGRVHGFDRETGDERSAVEVGHQTRGITPRLVDDTLYVAGAGDGPPAVVALDPDEGEERWRYDEFAEGDDIGGTPAVADDRLVFVNSEPAHVVPTIYALDLSTGTVDWQYRGASDYRVPAAVQDGKVLITTRDHVWTSELSITALDIDDGSDLWHEQTKAINTQSSPAVAEGTVYVAGSRTEGCPLASDSDCDPEDIDSWGQLYALDLSDGERLWTTELRRDTRSSPAVVGDTVYVGNGDGITAVDRHDGSKRWDLQFPDSRGIVSSPAVADGTLVVGGPDGILRVLHEPDA